MDEKVNLRQAKKELLATGVERVDVQENKWQYILKDGFFEGWHSGHHEVLLPECTDGAEGGSSPSLPGATSLVAES